MTKDEAVIKLEALGNSPEEIRKSLFEKGIKGSRSNSCDCPIANYLKQPDQGISVCCVQIGAYTDRNQEDFDWEFKPADPVKEFVNRFDYGQYPELEK